MSKNKFGKVIACLLIIGAVAACVIVYLTKYRDFQKSLDEDFNDFEEDTDSHKEEDEEEIISRASSKREYVSIPLDSVNHSPEPESK